MLEYEDAYHDLQVSLIEVIKKLSVKDLAHIEDKYYLSYIKKSINSKYLKLSKKIQDIKNYTLEITDDETNVEEYIDAANPVIDNYTLLFFNDMTEFLTGKTLLDKAYEINNGEFVKTYDEMINEFIKVDRLYKLNKIFRKYKKKILNIKLNKPKNNIRIAIIGELFTLMEPFANYNIEDYLINMGVEIKRFTNV